MQGGVCPPPIPLSVTGYKMKLLSSPITFSLGSQEDTLCDSWVSPLSRLTTPLDSTIQCRSRKRLVDCPLPDITMRRSSQPHHF